MIEFDEDDMRFVLRIHHELVNRLGSTATEILLASRFYRMFIYSPDEKRAEKSTDEWVEHIIREYNVKFK